MKNTEDLNSLCEKIDQLSILEELFFDLIHEDYSELLKYDGYIQIDRLATPKEQVLLWLSTTPFYLKKIIAKITESALLNAINHSNNNIINTILMIINIHKFRESKITLYYLLNYSLTHDLEIKVYFTILNLEKELGLTDNTIDKIKATIDINKKPYLLIVLLNIYNKYSPITSLEYLINAPEIDFGNNENRVLYLNTLSNTTLNFFDFYNSTPVAVEMKAQTYIEWIKSINNTWVKNIVLDVFELKRLEKVKNKIESLESDIFINLYAPPKVEIETQIRQLELLQSKAPKLLFDLFKD